MKTADDFKKVYENRKESGAGIYNWHIHTCSMCGYLCGFVFENNGEVRYDSGCYCLFQPTRLSSWEAVASHFNMQKDKKYIEEMKQFWGFS